MKARDNRTTNPIVVLLSILLFAGALTYLVDSGEYARDGKLVVANSYQTLEKSADVSTLVSIPANQDPSTVSAVSFIDILLAIPQGLEKGSGLIFMVLIIGGMFGLLTNSGAIDAGLERVMSLVKGNVTTLVICLMFLFSAGSTFLGLASEYLLVIPIMVALSQRLGIPHINGFAIVCVSVKAGYLSSVTNPLPLTIAQPLLDIPVFSGAGMRFIFFLIFTIVGIAFVLWTIKKAGGINSDDITFDAKKLSLKHFSMLMILIASIGFLVYASSEWHWKHKALSAYYIGISILLAVVSGLGASQAADAFVDGMKKVLLASFLIGVATAVAVVLEQGKILDTIIYHLMSMIGDNNATFSAIGMFFSQLLLDFMIPSTSGQAAVSMPILGPIGQLSGVSPQTTLLSFLFGNGITNMITPTSGTLLAYLATARVSWTDWAKYILPLWAMFIVIAMVMLAVSVAIGF